MGSVRTAIFRAATGIYQFAGGTRGLDQVDTIPPIQPVVNLQRLAEIGSGFGQFWGYDSISLVADHAALTTAYDAVDPFGTGIMGSLQTREQDCWAWIIEASARAVGGGTISAATLALAQTGISGAITNHLVPILRVNGDMGPSSSGGDQLLNWDDGAAMIGTFPKLVTPGQLQWRSVINVAGAGRSTVAQLLMWYGPRGVLPPGLA